MGPVDPARLEAVQGEEQEARDLAAEVGVFSVDGQDDFTIAEEILAEVKRRKRWLETERKKITKPQREALEAVRALFREPIKLLDGIERAIKAKLAEAWEREHARQQAELEVAGDAAVAGDHDAFEASVKRAEFGLETGTTQMRKYWAFEVTDIKKVPREYLMVNEAAVLAVVRQKGSGTKIPGIRAFQKLVVASKS